MSCYIRVMQLMLMSMANISVQTNIWEPDQIAPRRSGSTRLLQRLVWNKLALRCLANDGPTSLA